MEATVLQSYLVAYTGPELLIPVDILWIPALCDWNTFWWNIYQLETVCLTALFPKFLPILLPW